MNDRDRLNRLRALRTRLERLPPSAERDRMLREVGSRAVDLESSEPQALIGPPDLDSEVPAEHPVRRTPRAPSTTARRPGARGEAARVRTRTAAADAFVASVRPTPALAEGLLLSLDDDAATPSESSGSQPWARGLRG